MKRERERKEKNSTRRLRQRDFQDVVRKERPIFLSSSSSFSKEQVLFRACKRKEGEEEEEEELLRKNERGKNEEIKKERETSISIDQVFGWTKSGFEILRGRIMTDEIPY